MSHARQTLDGVTIASQSLARLATTPRSQARQSLGCQHFVGASIPIFSFDKALGASRGVVQIERDVSLALMMGLVPGDDLQRGAER